MKMIRLLKKIHDDPAKITELERNILLATNSSTLFLNTRSGYEFNDALVYLVGTRLSSGVNTYEKSIWAATGQDINSLGDIVRSGNVYSMFEIGTPYEDQLSLQNNNILIIDDDTLNKNITDESRENGYKYTVNSGLKLHSSIQKALDEDQKILYFIVANEAGYLEGGHANLWFVLESGQLFSFGLSTGRPGRGTTTLNQGDGRIFMESPDIIFSTDDLDTSDKGKMFDNTFFENYIMRKKEKFSTDTFLIADMGQLRKGHIDRIMHIIEKNKEKTQIKSFQKPQFIDNYLGQELFTVRNVIDKKKYVWDIIEYRPESLNCSGLMTWIFQERMVCTPRNPFIKAVVPILSWSLKETNSPQLCARRGRSDPLKRSEIEDIVISFLYDTKDEFIKKCAVEYEKTRKYSIDNLGEGIEHNPAKSIIDEIRNKRKINIEGGAKTPNKKRKLELHELFVGLKF